MINVAVVVENFSPLSETFVYNQVIGLSKKCNVHVFCKRRTNSNLFPFADVTKIELVNPNPLKEYLIKRFVYFFTSNSVLKSQLKEQFSKKKIDLVLIHFGPSFLKVHKNIDPNIPRIVVFHGYDASYLFKKSPFYVHAMRKALGHSNVFPFAVSDGIRNFMLEKFPNKSIEKHYLGIDTNKFSPSLKKENTGIKKFIQISRLVEKKGIEFTIKAFVEFKRLYPSKNFKFKIVGSGPLQEPLSNIITSNDMTEEIELVGAVDQLEVNRLLQESDIYIQHSITANNGDSEGLPISLMEAMSVGLPIVSTYHSGIPELVLPENGILTKEKDILGIVKAIDKIWFWETNQNRERIIKHFSIDSSVSSLYSKISKLIS